MRRTASKQGTGVQFLIGGDGAELDMLRADAAARP